MEILKSIGKAKRSSIAGNQHCWFKQYFIHDLSHVINQFAGPCSAVGRASDSRARFDTRSGHIPIISPFVDSRRAVVSYWGKYVHKVLVNCLRGLSLPRKSMVRITDHLDMTSAVKHGRKTTQHVTINLI